MRILLDECVARNRLRYLQELVPLAETALASILPGQIVRLP
jgi:hypothetical protein